MDAGVQLAPKAQGSRGPPWQQEEARGSEPLSMSVTPCVWCWRRCWESRCTLGQLQREDLLWSFSAVINPWVGRVGARR